METSNGRVNVFSGIAHTLYLPPNSEFKLVANSEFLDIAYGWCKAKEEFPAKFVTPDKTQVVIFGETMPPGNLMI